MDLTGTASLALNPKDSEEAQEMKAESIRKEDERKEKDRERKECEAKIKEHTNNEAHLSNHRFFPRTLFLPI